MLRLSRWFTSAFPLVGLVAVLTLSTTSAHAQVVKSFKIKGTGVGPTGLPLPGQPARMHYVDGQATYLSPHHGEGTVQTLSIDVFDPAGGIISGRFGSGEPFVFKGANGDELACDYGDQGGGELGNYVLTVLGVTPLGQLIVEADWIADFVPQPELCTGTFAGVTGSWVMYAQSEPFVLGSDDPVGFSWKGEGKLTFKKRR